MAAIGAGSTPLHYAASGGEVKCCQILVSRGADKMAANCNGWLAVDVARMWNCNWLEHVPEIYK
jgi:E3 ubiquitin-protein ligase XBAT32/33